MYSSIIKTASELVDECLKDSKVTSAVRMRLAGLIAEKLREQYKAGMLGAAEICKARAESWNGDPPDGEELEWERYAEEADWCEHAIRAEAERGE